MIPRSALVLAAALLGLSSSLSIAQADAQSVKVVPISTTDLGQKASAIVTLGSFCEGNVVRFERINSSGNGTGTSFTVPAGQVMIATDVEFRTSGSNTTYEVFISGSSVSPVYASVASAGGAPAAVSKDHFRTGFVIGPGHGLTVVVAPATECTQQRWYVRGYLSPDR